MSRRAFTLLELLVALSIAGVTVLGGRWVLEGIATHGSNVRHGAAAASARANADHLLRELVGRMEIGATAEHGFGGAEHEVVFTSWCEVPDGWLERCRVRLAVDSAAGGGHALVLRAHSLARTQSVAQPLALMRTTQAPKLRYLVSAVDGGTWFRSWGLGITAPIAIGIIADGDTTIIPIGERG